MFVRVALLTVFFHTYWCVEVPTLLLNNGRRIPAIALGSNFLPDETSMMTKNNTDRDVVLEAIDTGYRHFATFNMMTVEPLGDALQSKITDGQFQREDFYITSTLLMYYYQRDRVPLALRMSLNSLKLDYMDLYLLEWPFGMNSDNTLSDVDFMEAWRGMEDVLQLGLTKAIGVSNFNRAQLERVLREGSVKPAAILIELHPLNVQKELVEYAQAQGVVVMASVPFGSLVVRNGLWSLGTRVNDTMLTEISRKYGKTVPQVVLRWAVERNVIPFPMMVTPKRLQEHINIFDFKLEKADVDKISEFDLATRYILPSFWQNHTNYPFEKVDDPLPNPFLQHHNRSLSD